MNEIEGLRQELEQTKLAYQMAAQLSQLKTGFLARISHELRSPLSSLMGLHQLILCDLCENAEEQKEFIEQGYQVAHKLMNIIDEIVTVSKLEYGKTPFKIEKVNLNKVLNELENLTHLQSANYSIKVNIEFPQNEIYIAADEQRFLLGLLSLVDTGIGLLERGTIQVSTHFCQEENIVQIIIDIPCSINSWQQKQQELDFVELTLSSLKKWSQELEMSPGMKFLLCQTLLESMGGKLDLFNLSPENQSENFTRLQCAIPLASTQENH